MRIERIKINEFLSLFFSRSCSLLLALFFLALARSFFSLIAFHFFFLFPVQKKNTNNTISNINFDEANSFLLLYFMRKWTKHISILSFSPPLTLTHTHTPNDDVQIYHSECLFCNKKNKKKTNIKSNIERKEKEILEHIYSLLSSNFQLINFRFSFKFTWLIWLEFFLSTRYTFFINRTVCTIWWT